LTPKFGFLTLYGRLTRKVHRAGFGWSPKESVDDRILDTQSASEVMDKGFRLLVEFNGQALTVVGWNMSIGH
jgi:hypothetical protein